MPSRLLIQPLPPPTPPPPPLPAKNHRHVLLAVTTAAASVGLLLLLLLLLALHLRRRRHRHPTLPFSPPQAPVRPLRRYSRRALRRATGGFHPSRLLGRGAASPVYLATFPDASLVAVKTCSSPHELHVLSSLPADSPCLVSLLGYSGSGSGADQPLLLVYQYLPQGSLQGALFGDFRDGWFLDWTQRLAVISDVACALAFLHTECQPPVVHGDLKIRPREGMACRVCAVTERPSALLGMREHAWRRREVGETEEEKGRRREAAGLEGNRDARGLGGRDDAAIGG